MEFSVEERKQYNRHLILNEIGEEGQRKLKKAKVLVIGAGGLGCPILQYLTAAGVGNIGIVDHDVVDQSNLQRQILYTHDDIGLSKSQTAAQKLSRLNPFVNFDVYQEALTKENALELFAQYDIIVDGSDNFPTRYLANDAAVITDKPLVFGAIFKFEGQVSVFNYQDGPTYRCLFPTPPPPHQVPNCSEIGVMGVLPGIIGALQANEVIKIICELGSVLSGKLLSFSALTMKQLILSVKKNEAISIDSLDQDYQHFCGIPKETQEISLAQYQENESNFHLLDVRTEAEREEFHIGGIHIPLNLLPEQLADIPTNKPLVVYCKSGIRSKAAIGILQENIPALELFNLTGGLLSENLL